MFSQIQKRGQTQGSGVRLTARVKLGRLIIEIIIALRIIHFNNLLNMLTTLNMCQQLLKYINTSLNTLNILTNCHHTYVFLS
jgi:hypothetical protein